MFGAFLLCLYLISSTSADDPIIHLSATCPSSYAGSPVLNLKADVPAYAAAKCMNGVQRLETTNNVDFHLVGSFDRLNIGQACQFLKKDGVNTFTIEVEVGWGDYNSQVINHVDIKIVSCAYDDHGNAVSDQENMADWFLAPYEVQNLAGQKSRAIFDLKVVDVLDQEVDHDHISIGRKIRLRATDTSRLLEGFRALSCAAKNSVTTYPLLRAGCGDGLVFSRSAGFTTQNAVVYSPYFDAFKLKGGHDLWFECNFTACARTCDGDSCATEARRRRSLSAESQMFMEPLMATTLIKKKEEL